MTGGYNNMYFTSDLWENWTDTFDARRAQRAKEGKGLFINATCYVNPSPVDLTMGKYSLVTKCRRQ